MPTIRRFAWFAAPLLVAPWLLACGGDDSSGGEKQPDQTETPNDVAPEFDGVRAVDAVDDTSALVRWAPALDDHTIRGRLIYRVYSGRGADGGVDTTRPVAVSVPGATSALVTGLSARETYRFVVRAVDEAGHEDDNRAGITFEVPDHTSPTFAGITGATAESSTRVLVQWKPAADNADSAYQIRYRIYAAVDPDEVFESPVATTSPGATHISVDELASASDLYVAVRAVDESDNEDANQRVVLTSTPEGNPPTFLGVREVTPKTTSAELRWSPAADDTTASSGIVYAIYVSKSSGGQNLLAPAAVTPPGVTRFTLEGLEPGTKYYFLVRARDLAGNEDTNTQEVPVETSPPDVEAPIFDGVKSGESLTPTSITLGWNAASDTVSGSEALVYEVFLADEPGEQDFSSPVLTTLPGRTSVDLLGLDSATGYAIVVRARDEAGNSDQNTTEVFVTTGQATGDEAAPVMSGKVSIQRVPSKPSWLLVSYPAATDDQDEAADIRYHVCVATTGSGCGAAFASNLNVTTAFGQTNVFVTDLEPRTLYTVSVRPEDSSGNVATSGITAESTTATSFQGNVLPFLESRCNQCHDYDYGKLVQVPSGYGDEVSGDLYLVESGNASRSYLYRKIRALDSIESPFSEGIPNAYEEARMPSDGTDWVSDEDSAMLLDWIAQGAFDN